MAQQRGHETPMDFEFQNKTGPLDLRSPFAQVGQNVQRFPPLSQTPSKKRESPTRRFQSNKGTLLTHPQGPASAFGSPLRNSPNKPLPSVPAFNALYSTPRKLTTDVDDSSAGETPQSRAADSDATPDNIGYRSALTKFDNMSMPTLSKVERPKSSPSKEKERPTSSTSNSSARRESIFGKLKSKLYSPGRGEVPRADYSQAMDKRVRKRRERELQRNVARRRRPSMSESGDDSERPADRGHNNKKSPRKTSGTTVSKRNLKSPSNTSARDDENSSDDDRKPPSRPSAASSIASLFTFIAQHPTVPHILSFYAQLCFNIFLLGGCAWLIYCFWATVQGDVEKRSYEAMAQLAAEIAVCADHYRINRCDPAVRLPGLRESCEFWHKCMIRDPATVGRAKVSAHTFAEIFNSFVEPISYKAMIFTFILVFGCFAVSNMAFGFFREKTANAQFPQYYAPPPTPQRSFSGQDAAGNFYGTPWHSQALTPHPGMEPQPSGGFSQIEGRGSPVRRLVYN